jgi:hypothetical protein
MAGRKPFDIAVPKLIGVRAAEPPELLSPVLANMAIGYPD